MMMVLLPMNVRALDFTGEAFGSEDAAMSKTTLNGGTITCPKSTDKKTATCYLGIKVNNGNAKNVIVEASLTNMAFEDYDPLTGWDMKSPTISGNTIKFDLTNKTGIAAGNTVVMVKITFKVTSINDPCSIKITKTTPGTVTKSCVVESGKYYCKAGAECTKTEYEKECTPENPQTGSFVPYVVVIAGLGIAGAFYFMTRKKAKIYHV